MELADLAEARFKDGYSCSQSVFSALAGLWDLDPAVSLRVSAGFGGGLARTAGTCGCVTGGIMAIGMAQRSVEPLENRAEKEKTYELCQRFLQTFEDRNGSSICRDLLGCDISTPSGLAEARERKLFQSRCAGLVRDTVGIVLGVLGKA